MRGILAVLMGRVWKQSGSGGFWYTRICKSRAQVCRVLEKSNSGGQISDGSGMEKVRFGQVRVNLNSLMTGFGFGHSRTHHQLASYVNFFVSNHNFR